MQHPSDKLSHRLQYPLLIGHPVPIDNRRLDDQKIAWLTEYLLRVGAESTLPTRPLSTLPPPPAPKLNCGTIAIAEEPGRQRYPTPPTHPYNHLVYR